MSSSAHLTWDEGEGINGKDWAAFCKEHGLTHSPSTIGGNVFYAGRVEISFGESNYDATEPPDYAEQVDLSTFHFGDEIPGVARLARALWQAHGGRLSCDPEIRPLITRDQEVEALKADLRRWALHASAATRPAAPTRPALDMKVLASIEFPGSVYLTHDQAQGLPAEIEDRRSPWVRGVVPGGELIVLGVPLGIVHEVRPESEALHLMGEGVDWVTHRTTVLLNLDLGALLGSSE